MFAEDRLFRTNLKHRLDGYVTIIFLLLLGGIGCVQVSPKKVIPIKLVNKDALPSPESVILESFTPVFKQIGGMAFSKEGDLFLANFEKEGQIGKYQQGMKEPEVFIDLEEWISPVGDFMPKAEGIRVDKENRVLVADAGTGKLLRISPSAHKLEVLADSYDGYRFGTVKDLAIAANGDLFVSSPLSGTIYRIRPDIGYVGILNDDLVRVEGLAMSPNGKQLVAAEPDASRVVVYDIPEDLILVDSWTLVDFSPSGVEPKGVAFDEKGRLFIALGNLDEVRVFDLDLGIELARYDVGSEAESISYWDGSLYIGGGERIKRLHLRD
jgi:sugar lactone lactonase YvrE